MSIRQNYNHTLNACYLGYITQAIVNNFAPLLFLTFQKTYVISLEKIAILVSLNFIVQLIVDLLAARYMDKIGYRIAVVTAHLCSAGGLVGLAVFPKLLPSAYMGLIAAVVLFAIGGGLIEVLISPMVEACPTKRKEAAMSLLHSFYCWGHVAVVLLSTLFFVTIGIGQWKLLAILWALVPLGNMVYFTQVPILTLEDNHGGMSIRALVKNKLFWIFALLMVCAGASEQGMSQWASAFAESGLGVSKTVGDLAGPCFFAIMMGTSRSLYAKYSERLNLKICMVGSAVLCIAGYLLASLSMIPVFGLIGCGVCGFSVGIFWPGTFSLASPACPTGGTAMFALLALAGDLGCAIGPGVVGTVSEVMGNNLKKGLLSAVIFPMMLIWGVFLCRKMLKKKLA